MGLPVSKHDDQGYELTLVSWNDLVWHSTLKCYAEYAFLLSKEIHYTLSFTLVAISSGQDVSNTDSSEGSALMASITGNTSC